MSHISLITTPDVWLTDDAVRQLEQVAAFDRCTRAVGLPDLHAGPGIPIGAAFAFDGIVRPSLVGGDAGCGVRCFAVPKVKHRGEKLVRRVDAEFDGGDDLHVEPEQLVSAAWHQGPHGLASVPGIPDDLAELAAQEAPEDGPSSGPTPAAHWAHALGTIGGGNHFAEVGRVGHRADDVAADALGLVSGGSVVLVHSGSRGLGKALADRWRGQVLEAGADLDAYLADLRGAVRFARTNRLILSWKLLRAIGASRPSKISGTFDVTHNTVAPTSAGWVHRKGAAPAEAGQPTVVLGSRGTPSWVMRGLGQESALCCVAHGAGRRMSRSEARGKLRQRYHRGQLARSGTGRVLCNDRDLLYEEHPDAYKDIESVVQAIEQAGAAERIVALEPLVTVKR